MLMTPFSGFFFFFFFFFGGGGGGVREGKIGVSFVSHINGICP